MEMDQTNKLPRVAYFCMEYGLHEDFKIYSGGLGILAGDLLKAAKDGGYPMVGIGILWRQGYTHQIIGRDGTLYDCFPDYRYDFLKDTGVTVQVLIRGRQVKAKVWECEQYGNVPLYLLDTCLPQQDSCLTGQLYGWFEEERIAQEMLLGIGGVRALRKLGIDVDIYHFNDSHPLFAGIELIREQMEGNGLDFDDALEHVRKHIVFTTHTPVKAGNETHGHDILQYMGAYDGLTYGQMLQIGGSPFSMTAAGLYLSSRANAVSKLHGETARKMWAGVPGGSSILSITNGVHNGTWQDPKIISAYKNGGDIWKVHMELKRALLEEVFRRNGVRLREDVLTVGFARRAAPYKRSDLIFYSEKIIGKLLREQKIQIIFSGKAHPNDREGKKIIGNLVNWARKYSGSVVFLQDYDMKIGKMLTRGCDVWLNNPIRPMEASGTSGMKAAMNGVLNFSVLDGWWPEACRHGVNGWQIGGGYTGKNRDESDAGSLYQVLTEEILPAYRNRDAWVQMMRASIEMSSWQFSSARMIKEYYEKLYSR
jgi:starch phosphorylase